MAKMGRPKKKASERRSHRFELVFTPIEFRRIQKAALKAGVLISDFIRESVLERC